MKIFDCKMCGHCCEGQGGIVLSPKDLKRLATFLGKTETEIMTDYCYVRNGKVRLNNTDDGYCVFFKSSEGCGIHPAKPDVCRAWPFFRGNLVDSVSLNLARAYCPGISRDCEFESFRSVGLIYLAENELISTTATALDVANLSTQRKSQ